MSEYLIGAGAMLALSFIGWIVATEMRLRTLQGKLLVSNEKNLDNAIEAEVHADTDAELDSFVRVALGRTDKPKS